MPPESSDVSEGKHLSSQRGSAELIRAVTARGSFFNVDHLRTLREERRDRQKYREIANKTKLKGLVRDLKVTNICLIIRTKSIGAWLIIRGTIVSDIDGNYRLITLFSRW